MSTKPHAFTLVQIQYFLAVAKVESMTLAAEILSVTQPTLSSAMKQLERALGAKLFVRTEQNRLRLTGVGRALMGDAEQLTRAAELVAENVESTQRDLTGELVVGVFSPMAPFRIPRILQEFGQLHPRVTLSFVDGNQSTLQRMLLDGRCDVVIMYRLDLDRRIQTTVLDRISPYALLPANHRLAVERGEIHMRELQDEPYVMLDLPHTREYYLGLFEWAGIAPNIRYRLDSFESVRSFVGAEHGYTILHQGFGLTHTYSGGTVEARRIQGGPPRLEIVLGAMEGTLQTRRARAFSRIARSVFAANPN
ncbi:Hydrogen peroxide-inducible genes activator [Leucobacter sp. 7(1)]|uniref:LysR family transcriptional regulator n=1 Tax=Leucobacter sp. 7(1) TaxID=1255613 RepID=UPI00097F1D48|nr:LysR family transcriptional regulator [Leucobacter sp. 7(1)]SJN09361.1 Hydrogen peroxide-inducible genes activator [Leucobacter sp. 7(1)]